LIWSLALEIVQYVPTSSLPSDLRALKLAANALPNQTFYLNKILLRKSQDQLRRQRAGDSSVIRRVKCALPHFKAEIIGRSYMRCVMSGILFMAIHSRHVMMNRTGC
jgi:hypothetical protein